MTSAAPVTIFVAVRNRPIYTWVCLDALYRQTRSPHKVVLIDMASDDPSLEGVITGFQRRGLLDEVVRMPRNDPALLAGHVMSRLEELAPYFVYMEADAVLADSEQCWLAKMTSAMDGDPRLAIVGSVIDQRDFVDLETARRLEPSLEEAALRALIKANSSERRQDLSEAQGRLVFSPHNPPGRLMMIRAAALKEVGPAVDSVLDARVRAAGYRTGVMTTVHHRHLSLLHIFDQPHYDQATRTAFIKGMNAFRSQGDVAS